MPCIICIQEAYKAFKAPTHKIPLPFSCCSGSTSPLNITCTIYVGVILYSSCKISALFFQRMRSIKFHALHTDWFCSSYQNQMHHIHSHKRFITPVNKNVVPQSKYENAKKNFASKRHPKWLRTDFMSFII